MRNLKVKMRSLVVRTLLAGIIATLTMDLCAGLGRRLGLVRGVDVALLARWFGLVLRGDVVHDDIATAPDRAVPLGVALLIHYLIGTTLAAVYIAVVARALRSPGLISAVI